MEGDPGSRGGCEHPRRGDEPLAELARELHHTPAAVDPPAAVPVNPFVGVGPGRHGGLRPVGVPATVLASTEPTSIRTARTDMPWEGTLGGDSTGLATRIRLIRRSSIAPQRRTTPSADPVIASRACQVRAGGPRAARKGPGRDEARDEEQERARTKRTTRGRGRGAPKGAAGPPRPWLRRVGPTGRPRTSASGG